MASLDGHPGASHLRLYRKSDVELWVGEQRSPKRTAEPAGLRLLSLRVVAVVGGSPRSWRMRVPGRMGNRAA
jgi:hypothetical protein